MDPATFLIALIGTNAATGGVTHVLNRRKLKDDSDATVVNTANIAVGVLRAAMDAQQVQIAQLRKDLDRCETQHAETKSQLERVMLRLERLESR